MKRHPLPDAAPGVMNTAPQQSVGEMLHDRIISAVELCCSRSDMLLNLDATYPGGATRRTRGPAVCSSSRPHP